MGTKEISKDLIKKNIQAFRFAEDLILLNKIRKNKKLKKISSNHIGENPNEAIENDYLKYNFKITNELAPKYFNLFKKVSSNLGYDIENVSPFIVSSSSINAACIRVNKDKYLIYLTSTLVEKMNDEQIMFVIGHELGHAIYEHHQLPIHGIMNHEYELKPNETLDVLRWSRMAEISADRAGLIGCRNLEAALGAKLVLSSGISSSNFDLVPEKFAKQTSELIDHLIKSESFEDLYSTHPFNPLRVNALYLFHECQELYENFGIGSNRKPLEEISTEIRSILKTMDGESPDTSEKENKSSAKKRSTKAKEVTSSLSDEDSLLFWGSVCVASKDSELLDNELETIMSLSSSEEAVVILNRLKLNNDPYKEAYKQLKLNMKNYINLAQPIKCGILQKLILVARADGQVTDTEKEILESICQEVGIPSAFYGKILSYL
jgi:hypothetical protein